ncbi:MAG: hypothetical protein ACRBK7_29070 [Acidimicrobiales bacterium]
MRYAVDTWAPDYGTSREDQLREASRPVDIGVEVPSDEWEPVTPDPSEPPPDTITFVDGVRRIDARIWIGETEHTDKPGVCATVAAGAVRCSPGVASIEAIVVERALFTSASNAEALDLGVTGRYGLRPLPVATDEALYLAVHGHMSKIEVDLADELTEPGLVVFDGPLGVRDGANAAGYIKSQHVQYLEDEAHQQVIGRLDPGQRTPLFHIGGEMANWSWYMRLPGPRSHSMSGVVRVELPGLGDVSCAAARADQITAALPRFASEAHKDARSPQNLYPIAGLERELRRRLGDAKLLDRALRRKAHESAGAPALAVS